VLKTVYERGYNHGFQAGQFRAMKEILRWMGILAEQIEKILRRKGS
jgi:hypothetical protein